MKNRISSEVRCPFYHSECTQKMLCEGVQKGTSLHLAFGSSKDMRLYKKAYCNANYTDCRVAKMLFDKYL